MSRFINADDLNGAVLKCQEEPFTKDTVYALTDLIPNIDLVRCRDCSYWEYNGYKTDNGDLLGFCNLNDQPIWDCDYCSYGQRRKSDEEIS